MDSSAHLLRGMLTGRRRIIAGVRMERAGKFQMKLLLLQS